MIFDKNKLTALDLLESSLGIELEVLENEYQEHTLDTGEVNTFHQIIFQITDVGPDISSIGVIFALALMSFTYAAPKGYSYNDFIPDEKYNLGYFLEGLRFECDVLSHEADCVSGRNLRTHISYVSGGKVTVTTLNRGRDADRWLIHLQGKKHIQAV